MEAMFTRLLRDQELRLSTNGQQFVMATQTFEFQAASMVMSLYPSSGTVLGGTDVEVRCHASNLVRFELHKQGIEKESLWLVGTVSEHFPDGNNAYRVKLHANKDRGEDLRKHFGGHVLVAVDNNRGIRLPKRS